MPRSINSSSPVAQQRAIGQLIYHAGISVQSDYESDGTGADPEVISAAFRNFFGFTCGPLEAKSSYTSAQWYNKIAVDIDAHRPVLYGMWQADWSDGHAVVCDGYQNGNEIHLNLGWSGAYDAWSISIASKPRILSGRSTALSLASPRPTVSLPMTCAPGLSPWPMDFLLA